MDGRAARPGVAGTEAHELHGVLPAPLAAFGRESSAAPDRFLIALAALDLLSDAAAHSPLLVIAELLGVPASDRKQFRVWSDAVMEAAHEITKLPAPQA